MILCRYLSNGRATAKSDVYAFGVVLFEIISGKEATIRTEGMPMKNPERRSLVSIVSTVNSLHCCPDKLVFIFINNTLYFFFVVRASLKMLLYIVRLPNIYGHCRC